MTEVKSEIDTIKKQPKTQKTTDVKVAKPKVKATPKTKEVKNSVKKPVKVVAERKINTLPTLYELSGLTISPAKVKNVICNDTLNKEVSAAIIELRSARPSTIDGKITTGTVINKLSEATKAIVSSALLDATSSKKEEYARKKLTKMSDAVKTSYVAAKKDYKLNNHGYIMKNLI